MRTKFPTSLEEDELLDYILYLVFVGGIFVAVAVILYITIIVVAIASRKCNCWKTELIVKWRERHSSKSHYGFIFLVLAVSFLVIGSMIFGLVENTRLHHRIVSIARHPTTVLTPTAQVVVNVNSTVRETSDQIDVSILLVEGVLLSVASITGSISNINNAILDVQDQFQEMQYQALNASAHFRETANSLSTLNKYQTEGLISGVPDTQNVVNVDETINSTFATANQYLNSTVSTFTKVLVKVNSTVADAVDEGNTQINKAKTTLRKQINDIHGKMNSAVHSLKSPNDTIISISDTAVQYEGIRHTVIIVLLVLGIFPLVLIFIGLGAKVPILYKFSFALAFFFMFWLIAFGGVFTIVHTAFSQACESREVLVINAIHKFTPDEYRVNLGNLNVGGSSNSTGDTEVVISLNTTTLQSLLACRDPTNFFDVFGLEDLINKVFGQIYDQLDKLEAQQQELFATNSTDIFSDDNLNQKINSTMGSVSQFSNSTQKITSGELVKPLDQVRASMPNITDQAEKLPGKVNETVETTFDHLNNLTSNVTTISGDTYSYFYAITNFTHLDPNSYPFNSTIESFRQDLTDAQHAVAAAINAQSTVAEKVSAITDATNSVMQNIATLQNLFGTDLNLTNTWNESLSQIESELTHVLNLLPTMYDNITLAINSIRSVLDHVNNNLRSDTQCGFAGSFYSVFSDEICVTSTSNAQAMAAALLLMGISYFLVCLLGVFLLKRHDMHRLMKLTSKGLKKIASMRVVTNTVSAVNSIVRATSTIIRPKSNPSTPRGDPPTEPSFRVLDHINNNYSAATSSSSVYSSDPMLQDNENINIATSPALGNIKHSPAIGNKSPRSPRSPRKSPRFAPSALTLPHNFNLDGEEKKPIERSSSMVKVIKGIQRGSASLAKSLGVSGENEYSELPDDNDNNNNNNTRKSTAFQMGLDPDLEVIEMDELAKDKEKGNRV